MLFPSVELRFLSKFSAFFFGVTVLLASHLYALELPVLTEKPNWSRLDKYHHTIKREEFQQLLREVYVPRKAWSEGWLQIEEQHVRVRMRAGSEKWYELPFVSDSNASNGKCPEEYWRSGETLRSQAKDKPLDGFRIALDPGHIGGKFSEMEGRHFTVGDSEAVREGNLALVVAKLLVPRLEFLGATSFLVRKNSRPVTAARPRTLFAEADEWLNRRNAFGSALRSKREKRKLIRRRSEILFFRTSEIIARSKRVNQVLRPDFVVCLHLNAAAWPDPSKPSLVNENHFHVLANGAYMGGEVALENQRLEMLVKLLNRSHREERSLAECMPVSFSRATGLPAFEYKGPNAVKVGDVPGVWARNLMANRLYECPVVFLEPYVANSKEAYARILSGHYQGVRNVAGKTRVSLFEEYADAVVAGIVLHAAGHAR